MKFLASPQLRGRATGSPELEKAAHFIAAQFHSFGLKPIDGKSYFQAFSVTTNAKLGTANHFEYSLDGKTTELKFQDAFIPFNFSSRARLAGEVVFAGYGITAPEYGYDDYAGIDAKGKIVLLLRHEPQEFDEKSVFEGKVYTEHSQFFSKAVNAKMHGALGVILINDRAAHRGDADDLEKFGAAVGPGDAGIPYVQIKADVAESWFTGAGKNLDEIQGEIDKDLHPRSFAFPAGLQIYANLDVERVVKTVHNVAGYLPGLTDEYVVIGAHYDHLGLGEQYSMAPSMAGTVHPGADDNASGTAGVIELARWYSTQPKQKRGILFLSFAGEELGLLGSSYYASHPRFPLERAVAMLNMDMIGRVRDSKIYIGGLGSGSTLKATVENVLPKYHLNVDFSDTTGYGSSDHTSFTAKQVPVLFFFSGLHSDYHRPSDTWDKIDAPDAVRLLALVSDITDHLREEAVRPHVRAGEGSRWPAWRFDGFVQCGPSQRLRSRFRQHPGFHGTPQRRALRGCARRLARRQGGSERRRRPGGIRRQSHPESLRFHLRATGEKARRRSGGESPARTGAAAGQGAADAAQVDRSLTVAASMNLWPSRRASTAPAHPNDLYLAFY